MPPVGAGELKSDTDQRRAAEALDRLQLELEEREDEGFFGKLFGRKKAQAQA